MLGTGTNYEVSCPKCGWEEIINSANNHKLYQQCVDAEKTGSTLTCTKCNTILKVKNYNLNKTVQEDLDQIEASKKRIEKLFYGKPYQAICDEIKQDIENVCDRYGFDITITGLEVTGSQRFGTPMDNSDLDIVFTYTSNNERVREDDLFNALNNLEDADYDDTHMYYYGYQLDINPIEDGDIDTYIKNASTFRKREALTEATRVQLAANSRNAGAYKDQSMGKNRFERKKHSKIAASVKQYNDIDMNQLFKNDRLEVKIPVIGETDTYAVTVRIDGVIAEIARNIKVNKYKLEFRTIIQSLTKVFNTTDVFINCTCPDHRFNFDF